MLPKQCTHHKLRAYSVSASMFIQTHSADAFYKTYLESITDVQWN